MKKDPIYIVEEFLHSPDPQVRRNGLAALGAIGNEPAADRLLNIALADSAESVRLVAEDELLQVHDHALPYAALQRQLAADKQTRRAVYALLGRLRGKGRHLPVSGLSLFDRTWLSATLYALVYPSRDWRFRARAFWPGMRGGILGTILFTVFLAIFATRVTATGLNQQIFNLLIFSGLVLSPLLAMVATQRATPINLHYDYFAGVLAELSWAALSALIIGIILVGLTQLGEGLKDASVAWAIALIVFPIFFAAVRGGTLTSYGLLVNRSHGHYYLQVAVGSSAGIIALTLTELFIGGLGIAGVAYNNWLGLVPASVALAYAYATVDAESVPPTSVGGRASRFLSFFLVGTIIASVLVLSLPLPPTGPIIPYASVMPSGDVVQAQSGAPLMKREEVSEIPFRKSFKVAFEQPVIITLEFSSQAQADYLIAVLRKDDETGKVIAHVNAPEAFEQLLEPGDYGVLIADHNTWESYLLFAENLAVPNVLPLIVERLGRVFASLSGQELDPNSKFWDPRPVPSGNLVLKINLNSDGGDALTDSSSSQSDPQSRKTP